MISAGTLTKVLMVLPPSLWLLLEKLAALRMQPHRHAVDLKLFFLAVRLAAALRAACRFGGIPLFNRNTATKPVAQGFLAFFIRNIAFACCALKQVGSACGSRLVAVLRFVEGGARQIAVPLRFELASIVALRRAVADANTVGRDVKPLQQTRKLVDRDRLAGAAVVFRP